MFLYGLNGKNNFVKLWDSANQIEKELNMNRSAILRCCRGIQNKSYWFIWMFEKKIVFKKWFR